MGEKKNAQLAPWQRCTPAFPNPIPVPKGRVSLAFRNGGYGFQRWAGTDRQKSKRACQGAGVEVSERRLARLELQQS